VQAQEKRFCFLERVNMFPSTQKAREFLVPEVLLRPCSRCPLETFDLPLGVSVGNRVGLSLYSTMNKATDASEFRSRSRRHLVNWWILGIPKLVVHRNWAHFFITLHQFYQHSTSFFSMVAKRSATQFRFENHPFHSVRIKAGVPLHI
jgi:hypothetical protein